MKSGQAKSITDLAEQEGVTVAYICRLLPLTCLAPYVIEAILDRRQPKGLRLVEMLGSLSTFWMERRTSWPFAAATREGPKAKGSRCSPPPHSLT
jgi:hypothetical protein